MKITTTEMASESSSINQVWITKSFFCYLQGENLIYSNEKNKPLIEPKIYMATEEITAIFLISELNTIVFATRKNSQITFLSLANLQILLTIDTNLPEYFHPSFIIGFMLLPMTIIDWLLWDIIAW